MQIDLEGVDVPRVASAVRRMLLAASPSLGGDCWAWAAYGQALLERLGVEAEIAVGWAAWRIGEGDHEVIAHAPIMDGPILNPKSVVYHAWLEVPGYILDFSTCTLRLKAKQMDALDGKRTKVTWCPEFLFAPKKQNSSLERVARDHAGLFYYERVSWLEQQVRDNAVPLEEEDTGALWLIYQNPQARVFGPNSFEGRP